MARNGGQASSNKERLISLTQELFRDTPEKASLFMELLLVVLAEARAPASAVDQQQQFTYRHENKVIHENKLLLEVSEEQASDPQRLKQEVTAVLQQKGTFVQFDMVVRAPKPQAQGAAAPAAAAGAPGTGGNRRLVDVLVQPSSRLAFAYKGKELRDALGVKVKDALTRTGVLLRQQRNATYGKLFQERKRPRWVNGVDISYVNDAGHRVLWNGPWVQLGGGAGNSGGSGSGGGTGTGGGSGSGAGGGAPDVTMGERR